jgi:hypothetical protein
MKRVKPSSVNVALRSLKALFARASEWAFLDNNVFLRIKMVRVPQQPPHYLNPQEQIALLSVVDDQSL